jgi:hypothetical protein
MALVFSDIGLFVWRALVAIVGHLFAIVFLFTMISDLTLAVIRNLPVGGFVFAFVFGCGMDS